jgi:hypothetical protein
MLWELSVDEREEKGREKWVIYCKRRNSSWENNDTKQRRMNRVRSRKWRRDLGDGSEEKANEDLP